MHKFKAATIVLMVCASSAALAQSPSPQRLAPGEAPKGSPTAVVDLAAEFPQMKGYEFVETVNTVPPGTGRALHSHVSTPEIVRVLSGTLTDARNGAAPVAYGPGSTLVNATGTSHMWANLGTEPLVFLAVAIRRVKPAS